MKSSIVTGVGQTLALGGQTDLPFISWPSQQVCHISSLNLFLPNQATVLITEILSNCLYGSCEYTEAGDAVASTNFESSAMEGHLLHTCAHSHHDKNAILPRLLQSAQPSTAPKVDIPSGVDEQTFKNVLVSCCYR